MERQMICCVPILLGALILPAGMGRPARLRGIIGYEIPIMLLVPLALCVALPDASLLNGSGLSPAFSIAFMALPAICASASALLRGNRGLSAGLIGALVLLLEAVFFALSGREDALTWLVCPVYLLVLCIGGFALEKQLSAEDNCPAFEAAEKAPTMSAAAPQAERSDTREGSLSTMNQTLKPGSAIRRGVIGAAIGAAAMAVLFIALGGDLGNVLYGIFCGTLYGFGFAFANWSSILRNTKKATVEGAAGIGIGVILSRMTDDKNWGMLGWLYFLFRIVLALAFGWIPGIWRGIQAIAAELNGGRAPTPAKSAPEGPAKDRPAAAPAAPVLYCLSGLFAGAELSLGSGEVITLGSDPASCQLVLAGEGIQPQHCQLGFDEESADWYIVPLSGGTVYRDGAQPLRADSITLLPRGTVLTLGQGTHAQRFRLG